MTKDKKCLLSISVLMQFIFAFFSLFFGVFVYEISQNLNIVISYKLIGAVFYYLVLLLLYKKINEKVISVLYKLSFLMSIVTILLVFTISNDRIFMVFVTQLFFELTCLFYYMPHEVATMFNNEKSQMRKFMGLSSALNLIGATLAPFLSGFIINYSTYSILFSCLIVIAGICFVLSFGLHIVNVNQTRYGLFKFAKIAHQESGVRLGYLSYFFYKFSVDGCVELFLPLLIYFKTGTNFSIGIYSAIANLFAGVILIIYCHFNKDKRFADWLSVIVQIVVSLMIIFFGGAVVYFIYYFLRTIFDKILTNDTVSSVFSMHHNTAIGEYQLEHFYIYNFYHHAAIILSGILGLIVYNLMNNIISISILLAVFSMMQIISTYLLHKSERLLIGNKN